VRHILDDDARALLSSQQVLDNLRTLADRQLIFECQCDLTDAWVVEHIVAFHATTSHRWVINHAGIGSDDTHAGPSLAHTSSSLTPVTNWFTHINTLAECPNIIVKASGWEMADRKYSAESITPIMGDLVKAFGYKRVMLASNFPLTILCQSYQDYWQMMHQILVQLDLDEEEQRALMGQNARSIYFTTT
jgi:predicted TIM-barrel fold metal-dependent hydrolase